MKHIKLTAQYRFWIEYTTGANVNTGLVIEETENAYNVKCEISTSETKTFWVPKSECIDID